MASATDKNATKGGGLVYRFGLVGLLVRTRDKIEDDLGGLGEVGVRGELGVPLSFLRRLQEGAAGAAVAALERDAGHGSGPSIEEGKIERETLRARSDAVLRSPNGTD
ncbi:hypothetical protein NL676_022216 [Syzygium grande]|nr:hypothetical protein NL676_022216 [Syzygium grande]